MIAKKNGSVIWNDIGCHPTPQPLVEEFANIVKECLIDCYGRKPVNTNLAILDIFAGDGRLGNQVVTKISSCFKSTHVTFLEVDRSKFPQIVPIFSNFEYVNKNAFVWNSEHKFDLIVSNPPYQILNAEQAKKLGFSWDEIKKTSRNLYGLGIIKGLQLLKAGGILAVIAPFGWLRGNQSKAFRTQISDYCSNVLIRANNHRGIFKDANQDTAIQIFRKRIETDTKLTTWRFGYNGFKSLSISAPNEEKKPKKLNENIRVRVGPIVWNREKKSLTSQRKNATVVVYGGNITHNGRLSFGIAKYQKRQFILKSKIRPEEIFKSPLILIRRTLRGRPGNWKIDSSLIQKSFTGSIENHVIAVEFLANGLPLKKIHEQLIKKLKKYYYISGSPSISTHVVRRIAREILAKVMEQD